MSGPSLAAPLAGALLLVAFASMELFLRKGEVAKSVRTKPTDRGTSALIVAAYLCAVVAISSHRLPGPALPDALAWTGVAFGAFGLALRLWAMRALGAYYTRTLVTTAGQPLVRAGPYRLVRHPGYLGSLLVWTGAAASSRNLVSLAAVLALLAVAYAYRIAVEERMLVGALGEAYVEYQRRSWRLVPFVF